jgi:hypothetical protein
MNITCDLFQYILNYLPLEDILNSKLVNKKLYEFINNEFRLKHYIFPRTNIELITKHIKYLKRIEILEDKEINDDLLLKSKKLETLILFKNKIITDNSIKNLAKIKILILPKNKNIKNKYENIDNLQISTISKLKPEVKDYLDEIKPYVCCETSINISFLKKNLFDDMAKCGKILYKNFLSRIKNNDEEDDENEYLECRIFGLKGDEKYLYSELWLIDFESDGQYFPIFLNNINTSSYYALESSSIISYDNMINMNISEIKNSIHKRLDFGYVKNIFDLYY